MRGEKNLFEFMEITLQLVLEAELILQRSHLLLLGLLPVIVPVSIHDLSVTLSGARLANSRWASVPSKQQGSPQFWAQVQLFLFDASGQPWATCLLGVCVPVLAMCGLPCFWVLQALCQEAT